MTMKEDEIKELRKFVMAHNKLLGTVFLLLGLPALIIGVDDFEMNFMLFALFGSMLIIEAALFITFSAVFFFKKEIKGFLYLIGSLVIGFGVMAIAGARYSFGFNLPFDGISYLIEAIFAIGFGIFIFWIRIKWGGK